MSEGDVKPVLYQRRMRPDWDSRNSWMQWENCSKGTFEDCKRVPVNGDWSYESRALYEHPPKPDMQLTREWISKHQIKGVHKNGMARDHYVRSFDLLTLIGSKQVFADMDIPEIAPVFSSDADSVEYLRQILHATGNNPGGLIPVGLIRGASSHLRDIYGAKAMRSKEPLTLAPPDEPTYDFLQAVRNLIEYAECNDPSSPALREMKAMMPKREI